MARLLDWIPGLAIVARTPLTGPRSVGSSSTESLAGYVQTVASPFGQWRYQFTVRPMRGRLFRLYRGMITALHAGANAVRVPWCDPDIMSWEESGVDATPEEIRAGVPWSNGASFSNGENWSVGRPWEGVGAAAAKGDTEVTLSADHWGGNLVGGEDIGFVPFHFGKYRVTEIIDQDDDSVTLRIWPPLAKALATTDYVTLTPVSVMRLESEAAATASRGARLADGNTLTMIEVTDDIVRSHFTE